MDNQQLVLMIETLSEILRDNQDRLKFQVLDSMLDLLTVFEYRNLQETVRRKSEAIRWAESVRRGLFEILSSKIGEHERNSALLLTASMLRVFGYNWLLFTDVQTVRTKRSDASKSTSTTPSSFAFLVMQLCRIEIALLLDEYVREQPSQRSSAVTGAPAPSSAPSSTTSSASSNSSRTAPSNTAEKRAVLLGCFEITEFIVMLLAAEVDAETPVLQLSFEQTLQFQKRLNEIVTVLFEFLEDCQTAQLSADPMAFASLRVLNAILREDISSHERRFCDLLPFLLTLKPPQNDSGVGGGGGSSSSSSSGNASQQPTAADADDLQALQLLMSTLLALTLDSEKGMQRLVEDSDGPAKLVRILAATADATTVPDRDRSTVLALAILIQIEMFLTSNKSGRRSAGQQAMIDRLSKDLPLSVLMRLARFGTSTTTTTTTTTTTATSSVDMELLFNVVVLALLRITHRHTAETFGDQLWTELRRALQMLLDDSRGGGCVELSRFGDYLPWLSLLIDCVNQRSPLMNDPLRSLLRTSAQRRMRMLSTKSEQQQDELYLMEQLSEALK
jgi:hypothetical protein